MTPEKKERSSGGQVETAWMVWLKRIWHCCSAERVQATGTAIIALVTTWALFFTPLGERLVSEINQTVRETQQELEHHRTVATTVTLRALWRVADNRLAENEYFARIAQDYRAHTKWIEEHEGRLRGSPEQNKSSSPLPSDWWLRPPPREGRSDLGVFPLGEKGRWGERTDEIRKLWPPLLEPWKYNYRELRRKLDRLLEAHLRGYGYGAPSTGKGLIDQMKAGETVDQLGSIGSETVRQTFDRFLRVHPDLASTTIRVQLEGPYSEIQVVEIGEEVTKNVSRFRNAFRAFIKSECGPFF